MKSLLRLSRMPNLLYARMQSGLRLPIRYGQVPPDMSDLLDSPRAR